MDPSKALWLVGNSHNHCPVLASSLPAPCMCLPHRKVCPDPLAPCSVLLVGQGLKVVGLSGDSLVLEEALRVGECPELAPSGPLCLQPLGRAQRAPGQVPQGWPLPDSWFLPEAWLGSTGSAHYGNLPVATSLPDPGPAPSWGLAPSASPQ
jgi:hypothetical protein